MRPRAPHTVLRRPTHWDADTDDVEPLPGGRLAPLAGAGPRGRRSSSRSTRSARTRTRRRSGGVRRRAALASGWTSWWPVSRPRSPLPVPFAAAPWLPPWVWGDRPPTPRDRRGDRRCSRGCRRRAAAGAPRWGPPSTRPRRTPLFPSPLPLPLPSPLLLPFPSPERPWVVTHGGRTSVISSPPGAHAARRWVAAPRPAERDLRCCRRTSSTPTRRCSSCSTSVVAGGWPYADRFAAPHAAAARACRSAPAAPEVATRARRAPRAAPASRRRPPAVPGRRARAGRRSLGSPVSRRSTTSSVPPVPAASHSGGDLRARRVGTPGA